MARRSDGGFTEAEAKQFMAGDEVFVRSSNVLSAWWEAGNETLYLRFKDGSLYQYSGFDRPRAIGFTVAPSKGGYVHDWLKQHGGLKVI